MTSTTRRPRLAITVTALSALLLGGAAWAATPTRTPAHVQPAPEVGPLVSGTSLYQAGVFAQTDYVYDDTGAATASGGGGSGAYPEGFKNAADFVQTQVRPVPSGTEFTVILETLRPVDRPVVGLALDTDGKAETGAAALPGGSWTPAAPLGVDTLLVLTRSGSSVLRWTGQEWRTASTGPAHVDVAANTLGGRVPDTIGARTWRMLGVVGTEQGTSWLQGGPIMDTACNDDVQRAKQDVVQADVLAGGADPQSVACTIDGRALQQRVTRLPDISKPGSYVLLHHSRYTLPESQLDVESVTAQAGVFGGSDYMGPYQPYRVVQPAKRPARAPMLVILHGSGGSHLGTDFDVPGVVQVFPLGRTNSQSFDGFHEADVLEAMEDAIARLNIDRNHIGVTGISMGGYGAMDLAAYHPDLFTSAFSFIGGPGPLPHAYEGDGGLSRFPGFLAGGAANIPLAPNFRHVPVRLQNGVVDPLAPPPNSLRLADRLEALGFDYRLWIHPTRTHELVPQSLFGCVWREQVARARVVDPARVTYVYQPAFDTVVPEWGLEQRHDGAYWVSGMRAAAGVERASVDLTSLAAGPDNGLEGRDGPAAGHRPRT
jgi:predicted esterase